MKVTLRVGARTDVGCVRAHNEDSYLVGRGLFAVADGMGGHQAGDLASASVVRALSSLATEGHVSATALQQALAQAQADVAVLSAQLTRGAGSTVVVLALDGSGDQEWWTVAHVGDSRAYQIAGGAIERLTVDHSLVQEMVDAGEMTAQEAAHSRQRNVITRAVGSPDSPPDISRIPVLAQSRLLLCSDGLSSEVPDAVIATICSLHVDAQAAADALVDAALQAGGRDNVTAIVVDVTAGGDVSDDDDTTQPRVIEDDTTNQVPVVPPSVGTLR